RLAPNIYKFEQELQRSRFARWRLSRAITAAAVAEELDQSWKLTPYHLAHKAAFRQSEAYKQRLSVEKIAPAGYLENNSVSNTVDTDITTRRRGVV
ncbi:MAG: hypothetical protein RM368_37260, partial [Nostoc sp. DedSLP03]|uniref:hypothetical protein n=1 Tax=Nostoc sp. DedSLP03 TaxID=3075400 RepID=UPI002AD25D1C